MGVHGSLLVATSIDQTNETQNEPSNKSDVAERITQNALYVQQQQQFDPPLAPEQHVDDELFLISMVDTIDAERPQKSRNAA